MLAATIVWLLWAYLYHLLLIVSLILGYYICLYRRCTLPGPYGLPLVGYLPFLGKKPHVTFATLAEKYGPVFQIRLGSKTVVVLNDMDVIQGAFNSFVFAGRPKILSIDGLLESCNVPSRFMFRKADKTWAFLRQCSVSALQALDESNKSSLDDIVKEQFLRFCGKIDDASCAVESGLNPNDYIIEMVSGIMAAIIYGSRPGDLSSDFLHRANTVEKHVGELSGIGKYLQNSTRNVVPNCLKSRLLQSSSEQKDRKLTKPYDFPLNLKPGNPRDQGDPCNIQSALMRVSVETTFEQKFSAGVCNQRIWSLSHDLFAASVNPMIETFRWYLALLAHHVEIQREIQTEIDVTFGLSQICLSRPQADVPYLEASLLETYRFSSVLPLLQSHNTLIDALFEGYFIPKDCVVVANAWSVHQNMKSFKNPENFIPGRYLANGVIDPVLRNKLVAFSVGKRRCIGESLAHQVLCLLCAFVLQRYDIRNARPAAFDPRTADFDYFRTAPEIEIHFCERTSSVL